MLPPMHTSTPVHSSVGEKHQTPTLQGLLSLGIQSDTVHWNHPFPAKSRILITPPFDLLSAYFGLLVCFASFQVIPLPFVG